MRSISAVVNDRKPLLLLIILAKLTLNGAVCLFTKLCDTLTDLRLFYEHRHNIVKLSNIPIHDFNNWYSSANTVMAAVVFSRKWCFPAMKLMLVNCRHVSVLFKKTWKSIFIGQNLKHFPIRVKTRLWKNLLKYSEMIISTNIWYIEWDTWTITT